MAYAFIVEDGTGVANANSYVSVEYADDYLVQNLHAAPLWALLTVTEKEYLLSWASRYLDQHTRWAGYPTYPLAALKWPRSYVRVDRTYLDSQSIPEQVKQATVELAKYLLQSDPSAEAESNSLSEIKVDVIEIVFNSGYRLPKFPDALRLILDGLGYLSGSGSTFGRIRKA